MYEILLYSFLNEYVCVHSVLCTVPQLHFAMFSFTDAALILYVHKWYLNDCYLKETV